MTALPSAVVPARYRMAANLARTNSPRDVVALALYRYVEEPNTSVPAIAAEALVAQRLLSRWAHEAGLPVRSMGRDQAPTEDEIRASCDAYLSEGSATAAGRRLGIARTTVVKRLKAAGVEMHSSSDAIREVLAARYDRRPGYVSIREAAQISGAAETTLRRWCEAGRIPGALHDSSILPGRPMWSIPREWAQTHRPARRRQRPETQTKAWLPAEPLGAWAAAQGRPIRDIADGMESVERALRRIFTGEQTTVALGWADRFLVGQAQRLEDVWPDVDAALTEGHRIRFANASKAATLGNHRRYARERAAAELDTEDRAA